MRNHSAFQYGLALAISSLLGGCCNNKPASEITLDNALKQVGQGLYDMHNAAHPAIQTTNNPNGSKSADTFGLYASDVTVTFNVESSKKTENANTLVISGNIAPPIIPVKAGASDTISNSTTTQNSRGNTIVITFKNPMFASSGELVHDTITGISSGNSTTANKPANGAGGGGIAGAGSGATGTTAPPPEKSADRVRSFMTLMQFLQQTFIPTAQ